MKSLTINKESLIIEVLIFCLIIYFSQGPVLPPATIFSQLALLIIILTSLYFTLRVLTLKIKHPPFIWALFLLIAINIIGYTFTFINITELGYLDFLKTILISTSLFYPFYYFSIKKKFLISHLVRLFLVLLLLSIFHFFYQKEQALSIRIRDSEDLVNNTGYYFVMLLPYVFLFKRKLLSYLSILIIMTFTIQSAKRGALITSLAGSLVFIYYQLFQQGTKNLIRNIVLTTVALASITLYLYNLFLKNDFLVTRLSKIDEGGSGRSTIYSNLIENWYGSDNILNFIFGYGFISSVNHSGTGNVAHNDWLEMLINFGLLGFAIYLFVFISLIYSIFTKKLEKTNQATLICITIIWFLISLFSMFYLNAISVFMVILLAYILGSNKAYS